MRIIKIFFPLLIIGNLNAQSKVQIRLVDCVNLAMEKSSSLKISQAKVHLAEAKSSEISTTLLPQLKFTGRVTELSSVPEFSLTLPPPIGTRTLYPSITENYLMRLTLQQPIFTGFKLTKAREVAELNTDVAREEFNKDKSELVTNVITAYWNLYRAYKIEEVFKQSVEQMNEHLRNVKNFAKQGLATDADVMKVQVQLSDVKVKHIESINFIKIASMRLNSLLGQPLEIEVVPVDSPQTIGEPILNMDLRSLDNKAKEQRPEIKELRLRNEACSANITAAKSGWYPQIYLVANYDYANPNQRIFPLESKWDGTWDVGLMIQWNIWDWFATKHQTTQAEANLRQAEATYLQVSDLISLEVAQQYYNAKTASEKVQVAQVGVEQAQESYRITSEKFKNGLSSNADLLDAEVALLQAKLTYTQTVIDYALAVVHLKKAIGEMF